MDVHLIIIIAVYFIFSVIAISNEISRIRYYGVIGIASLCRVMYILSVVIIPAIIYCGYMKEGITAYIKYDSRYAWTFYVGAIYTILTYLMFNFGYRIKQKDIPVKERVHAPNVTLLATIFVLVSIVSLFLWASGFGGVSMLVENANHIRAGFIGSSSNVAFFKHFVPLSLLSAFMIFNHIVINKKTKGKGEAIYLIILLAISMVASFIYILANDGRLLAGIFIMLFFLLKIKNDYEEKEVPLHKIILKLVLLIAIVAIIVLNADSIFRTIRGEETLVSEDNGSLFETVSGEFSFIVSGLQTAIINRNNGTATLTIVNDVVNGIFAWLPTSLKPILLEDVWDYNTALSNTGEYGQAPTSIVAQACYDLGMIGVILIPMLYGMLVRKIENVLSSYHNDTFVSTIYIVLGFYLAKGMPYFSLYNIMMNIFFIVLGCGIYMFFNKVRFKGGRL